MKIYVVYGLTILLMLGAAKKAVGQETADMPDAVTGHKLLGQGNYLEAVKYFKEGRENNPHDVVMCTGLGEALCKSGKPEEALMVFKQCVDGFSGAPAPYIARAKCAMMISKDLLPKAESDLKKALAIDPKNPYAHNELGLVYKAGGDEESAISEFETAIKEDPKLAIAYNNLAVSQIAVGKYEEAAINIQKAIKLTPKIKDQRLYQNLGIAFLSMGKTDHAEAAFLVDTALNPDSPGSHLNLGNIYVLKNRYNEAIHEYEIVLLTSPDDLDALTNLGALLVITNRPRQAIPLLEKITEVQPDSALAHHYLEISYEKTNKPDLAKKHRQKAIKLGYKPGNSPWGKK